MIILIAFVLYGVNVAITSYKAELHQKKVERYHKHESLYGHFLNRLKKIS